MISIIIPVYQCRWNIEQILDDIKEQTYQDYEVLLVDDGSTDGSAEACLEYAKKDSRIKAILKEHSGVGKTRNEGLKYAIGDYVAFIDADDRIEKDYLEQLYYNIQENDMVISTFDRWFLNNDNSKKIVENSKLDVQINMRDNFKKYFSELYVSTLLGTLVCKLYKRTLIETNKIRFRDDIYIGEDFCFNFDYFRVCDRVKCIPYLGYHYICKKGDSLTHKNDLNKFAYGKTLYQESIRFCKDMSLNEEYSSGVHNLYLRTCFKNIENVVMMDPPITRKDRNVFVKKVMMDSDTKTAIENAKPDTIEFKLYKIILESKSVILVKLFARMRLLLKKMVGRI